MTENFSELLDLLNSHKVEFVVIGGHALAFHGRPRFTEDIDVFVGPSKDNSQKLKCALDEFGAPIGERGAEEFAQAEHKMIRIGVPPQMVDILNFAGTVPFEAVYDRSIEGRLLGVPVRFPSREDLVDMKRSSGRPQDLVDLQKLE
jgi:hypothetical protein